MAATYSALLLDFYGTLVEEDTRIMADIVERISENAPHGADTREISSRWGRRFSELCTASHGSKFRTQREIEFDALDGVLREYGSSLDPRELTEEQFAYWQRPDAIDGAARLLCEADVPICIVSNIDTADLESAISNLGWELPNVVTSESCRAYKPRKELFEAGLASLGVSGAQVLHVGDSVGSDLAGARAAGLPCAWVNPRSRSLPPGFPEPDHVVAQACDVLSLLG